MFIKNTLCCLVVVSACSISPLYAQVMEETITIGSRSEVYQCDRACRQSLYDFFNSTGLQRTFSVAPLLIEGNYSYNYDAAADNLNCQSFGRSGTLDDAESHWLGAALLGCSGITVSQGFIAGYVCFSTIWAVALNMCKD